MRRYGLLIGLMLAARLLPAQEFQQWVEQMRKQYENVERLHVVMNVNVYPDEQTKKSAFQMKVDIKKDRENYLYRYGASDMLMNEKFLVMVDRDARQIVLSQRDLKSEAAVRKNFQFNLDSLLKFQNDMKYIGVANGLKQFRWNPKRGEVTALDLYVDEQSLWLRRMVYTYVSHQVASIDFVVFDKQPVFSDGTFAEQQYVLIGKNRLQPAERFKQYQVSTPNAR
jgi:outer membrane lipoprotein-sorting protein